MSPPEEFIQNSEIVSLQKEKDTLIEKGRNQLVSVCAFIHPLVFSPFRMSEKWRDLHLLQEFSGISVNDSCFSFTRTEKNAHSTWINGKQFYMWSRTKPAYSAIKKNKLMPFAATRMDLEIVMLSDVSQTQKNKYHMISLICGILKKGHKWTYLQDRSRVTDVENKLMVTRGWGGEG